VLAFLEYTFSLQRVRYKNFAGGKANEDAYSAPQRFTATGVVGSVNFVVDGRLSALKVVQHRSKKQAGTETLLVTVVTATTYSDTAVTQDGRDLLITLSLP